MSDASPNKFRWSANISMMFADLPFLERIDAAARAGFPAVECHFPYDLDRSAIRERLLDAGLVMNGLNTPSGDAARGEFGFAAVPGRKDDFRRGLDQSLAWAVALGAKTIHCMCGVVDASQRPRAEAVFFENMNFASDVARGTGIDLLIEPINQHDRPGWFVSRSDDVVGLLKKLGRDNVKLMFDFYHIQIMEGDLLRRMERHWRHIGHFQFASVPRRAEPDEGEINYPAIFAAIAQRGWPGWVAAEYRPRGATLDGLGWMRSMLPV